MQQEESPTTEQEAITEEENTSPKTYSLEDVESHNNKTDIWITIRNKVYDVTKFIDEVSYSSLVSHEI